MNYIPFGVGLLDVYKRQTIILSLQPGEIKTVRIHKGDTLQELAVTVSEYSADHGTELRLVNLKNIHAVLEENKMEAWQ